MITAETITTQTTRDIFHALMTAAEKSRRVMRLSEDSDITASGAADSINDILTTLNLALAELTDPAPEVPESLVKDLVKPLQLEVGKRYVRRDGGISGEIHNLNSAYFPFSDGAWSYKPNGLYAMEGASMFDLIAEYIEPAAEPSKMKIALDVFINAAIELKEVIQ